MTFFSDELRQSCGHSLIDKKLNCYFNVNLNFLGKSSTHLVVEEDSTDGRHHTQDIWEADWVAQHQQRYADNHDPLGGVSNSIAEWTDEVKNTEGDHILGKVTKATDEQKDQSARPSRDVRLKGKKTTSDLEDNALRSHRKI